MQRLPIRQILCLIFMFHVVALYGQVEHTAIPIRDFTDQSQEITKQKSTVQDAYSAGSYIIEPDNEGQLDFDTTLAQNLQQAMSYVRDKYNVPGVSAAVLIPGKGLWAGACGYSTLEPSDSIRPETISCIMSSTKSFMSAIILQLAEEGELALDDSIGSYLTNLPATISGQITIRQLLNMTSGLWDFLRDGKAYPDSVYADLNRYWTFEEIINILVGPPHSSPGIVYRYSNTNLILAGMIINNITQTNISTQLHQRIFEPLALKGTFYSAEETLIGPIAHPWADGKDNWTLTNSNAYFSFFSMPGGIYSTAEDLARWANSLFSGRVLDSESLEQMQSLIPADSRMDGYGLCIYKYPVLGKSGWGHDGWDAAGYVSIFYYYPPTGMSIALLENDPNTGPLDGNLQCLLNEYLKTLQVTSASQPGFLYMLSSGNGGLLMTANTPAISYSLLGPVLYSGLLKVKVHPVTGDLWGMAVNGGTLGYQLVKFDGLTGEAFPRVEISISETGSPIAMDFAADGTLYMATYQGKIFTVDTASGKGTLLASAEIQITSLAIQPETGEIWASAKDVQSTEIRIFKINRETGDTLGIGNTGINQKIKDIAFDAQGSLFGVTGSIPSQLFKIDTVTGKCTEVKLFDTLSLSSITFSSGAALGIKEELITDQPPQCELSQNYPNPFSLFTTISFKISDNDYIRLKIFNIDGREVATLVNEEMKPGSYKATWNAGDFPDGVYFYKLESGSFAESRKMVVMR
jgi:D-alanyl-D-alanine carboxypeptidase